LNYCTFNYSMSWWDWDRWEKEIDWMALHGINMPLAIPAKSTSGTRCTNRTGLPIRSGIVFQRTGLFFLVLDGKPRWLGRPLPQSWKESHRDLQQKILARERELGMKPVLPAFTGHVPASFKKFFPGANLKQTNWGNDFGDTYILDANDPLFAEIGRKFLEVQSEVYGTDHLYSADTFNENQPPSDDPQYLSELGSKVFEGMKTADPKAVWVMQGWLFYSHRDFWKPADTRIARRGPQRPDDYPDLAAEIEPVWKRTEAFYGNSGSGTCCTILAEISACLAALKQWPRNRQQRWPIQRQDN
jgi:alpha-N-acetylglucosaminidase